MRTTLSVCAVCAVLLPSMVSAGNLSFSGGVTATSNYLVDGSSQTANGPAIQPFFELGKNGLYAGVWASNLNDAAGNRLAVDLSLGYRAASAGGLEYEMGLTRHLFDQGQNDTTEAELSLGGAIGDKLAVSTSVAYDFTENTFGEGVGMEFAIDDVWGLHADLGKAAPGESVNWAAGAVYALNGQTSIDLQVQDTASTSPLVAISLGYAFGGDAHESN